jgi:RHS repeat-associated protein
LEEKNRTAKQAFYEYHYRQYDSWLGRWHVVDPMAEAYGTQSPYHFAGNNPVNNLEINGAVWQEAVADGIERDIDEWGNVASGGTGTRTTYRGPTTFFGSGGYYGNYSAGGNYLGSTFTGTFGGSTYTRMNMGRGFPEYTYNGGYYRDGNGNIVDWSEVEASLAADGALRPATKEEKKNWGLLKGVAFVDGEITGESALDGSPMGIGGGPGDGGDPNQSVTVYIETDFPGHAYIKIGNTIYDYGEWNGGYLKGELNDGNGQFGAIGKGILLKVEGKDAEAYVKFRTESFPTDFYNIYTLDASKMVNYFENLIKNGTPVQITVPSMRGGVEKGYHIDTYMVIGNHCATKVIAALMRGGDFYLENNAKYYNSPISLGNYLDWKY